MKERPILFSAPMVRAILDGSKTQTRRIVKPQPPSRDAVREMAGNNFRIFSDNHSHGFRVAGPVWAVRELMQREPHWNCPYGQPGERLWVRETFCPIYPQDPTYNGGEPIEYDYAATYQHGHRLGDSLGIKKVWKPSIHMPRAASRILLEVTGVRVEQLQEISDTDAAAEGVEYYEPSHTTGLQPCSAHRYAFEDLWREINGAGSWEVNPWVWAVEFKRITGAEAAAQNGDA